MRREEGAENPVIVTETVLTSYLERQSCKLEEDKKLIIETQRSIGRGKRTTVRISWI